MRHRLSFVFSSLFIFTSLVVGANYHSPSAPSQGYNINVRARQLANRSVYLGAYLNGKIFSMDTITLNDKGIGRFSRKTELKEGLYMLYLGPSDKYYDFLVGDDRNITLIVNDTTKETSECFNVMGADQSVRFNEFGKFMTLKKKQQAFLLDQYNQVKEEKDKKEYEKQLDALNKEVEKYQSDLAGQYKGTMLGLFVNTLIPPKFPKELINSNPNDTALMMKKYIYAKDHFFDNYNLSDPRSWRINMLNQKLDAFLNRNIFQIPDSIIPEAMKLVEQSRGDSTAFNLMTNYVISYAVQSKLMGMDKLFALLTETYYLTGKAFWADSTLMSNIKTEYNKIRYNQLGMKAWNMPLQELSGKEFNLYDVNAPYTLVYFFEPSCGHCLTTTPKIYDVYKKYRDKGFKVVAMYLMTDKKEWTDFLDKHQMYDWINAWDPDRKSYYWQFFDTSTTPGVYLLDKDKKFIAKKIDSESLDRILDYEFNKEKNGQQVAPATRVAEHELPIDIQIKN